MYSIRIDGDTRRLLKKIQSFEELDKKRLNASLGEGIRESTLERFKQGRGPDGKKWKSSIRASAEGGQTLVQTAVLRNSIHSRADASGFAVGTNVKYAATHQLGEKGRIIRAKTSRGLRFKVGGQWITKKSVKIRIPARPYLGISEDDLKDIRAETEAFISRED